MPRHRNHYHTINPLYSQLHDRKRCQSQMCMSVKVTKVKSHNIKKSQSVNVRVHALRLSSESWPLPKLTLGLEPQVTHAKCVTVRLREVTLSWIFRFAYTWGRWYIRWEFSLQASTVWLPCLPVGLWDVQGLKVHPQTFSVSWTSSHYEPDLSNFPL